MGGELAGILETIRDGAAGGRAAALATVVATWGSSPRPVGSHMVVDADGGFVGSVSGGCIEAAVIAEARAAIDDGRGRRLEFGVADERAWQVGLACGGRIEIYVERIDRDWPVEALLGAQAERRSVAVVTHLDEGSRALVIAGAARGTLALTRAALDEVRQHASSGRSGVMQADRALFARIYAPSPRLIIVGAVHIARDLAPMAALAGYEVTVVDPRRAFATTLRFPDVALDGRWPDEALHGLAPDQGTAVVTLTHDPKLDDPALIAALRSPAFYVGALGSRRTHAGRVARLQAAGLGDRDVARIHAPVGLDLGGDAAAEIAVAILAEITRSRYRPAAAPRIAALVLAAGRATRMSGSNKLLCQVDGRPLVRRVADAACASRCRPVMVVTGFAEEAIVAALGGAPVSLAHNADYASGLSTSLRRGLAALPADIDGALILLADMPWIGAVDIDRLVAAFDPADPSIVVPVRGSRRGNPVLWPRRHFAAIRALSGDSGARELLVEHTAEISVVDFDDDDIFADVDTPADLLRHP